MVRRRLAGTRPSPVRYTRSIGSIIASSKQEARELVVARAIVEAHEVVTLVLRDPAPDAPPFAFSAGQFFTLLVDVDGETVPRNYSASNVAGERELHVTVKRKSGGRVSGRLCAATSGQRLRVLGPFGTFTHGSGSGRGRTLVLVAGGVGITPLIAIARAALATEPEFRVVLVYANRASRDVAFGAALESLEMSSGGRLVVRHVLESPPEAWRGDVGRLDRANTTRILDALTIDSASEYFVCGPEGMLDEVLAALASRGVPAERIKRERFAIGAHASAGTRARGLDVDARRLTIVVGAQQIRTTALPGASLLEAGLAASVPMPFSCGVGGCGACRVRVLDGDVDLEEPHCLSDEERRAGYVLTCVGRPRGACTIQIHVRGELEGGGT
jgi:ring-1,2-phenylacetyl-CoA epoxidase subunit PaaE